MLKKRSPKIVANVILVFATVFVSYLGHGTVHGHARSFITTSVFGWDVKLIRLRASEISGALYRSISSTSLAA